MTYLSVLEASLPDVLDVTPLVLVVSNATPVIHMLVINNTKQLYIFIVLF